MTSFAYVRFSAVAAPALLLAYGVLRFFDGLDGHHGGILWDIGHTAFFLSFVLLAGLMIGLRARVVAVAPRQAAPATAGLAAALLGAATFLWVILGDLFPAVPPLNETLSILGALAFLAGGLVLLVQLATAHPRRLPVWSPVVFFAGFTVIGAYLDLLPLGAVLMGAALLPLAAVS